MSSKKASGSIHKARKSTSTAILHSPSPEVQEEPKEDVDSNMEETSDDSDDSEDLEDVAPKRRAEATVGAEIQRIAVGKLPRYEPPTGMMSTSTDINFASSAFEFDAMVSKPGVELWALRVPHDVKASRIASLNVSVSSAGPSGSLQTKYHSYTLRSAGAVHETHAAVDGEGRQPTAGPGIADAMTMDVDGGKRLKFEGGAEMGGMKLMVPRMSKGGKLFLSPVPITKRLVLSLDDNPTSASQESALPSLLATSALDTALDAATAEEDISAPPAKRVQPAHLLKFRNFATGCRTSGPMSLDISESPQTISTSLPTTSGTPAKKKRKSEANGDVLTKKKKVKV